MNIEYKSVLHLENNVKLIQLFFSHQEHRWIYEYVFRKWAEQTLSKQSVERGDLELYNNVKIIVDYTDGLFTGIEVTMEIVNPRNRGKKFFTGVDISPNSKVFLNLKYKQIKDDEWALDKIEKGAQTIYNSDEESQNLPVLPVDTPFPLYDRLKEEHGKIMWQILQDDMSLSKIAIQTSLVN